MNLLELAVNSEISIKHEKYRIMNVTKFVEKSSYWIEYKIMRLNDSKEYYLNVELSSKAILYEILRGVMIEPQMTITYNGDTYELYEKGLAKVETYSGMTDVRLTDEAHYYEYENLRNKKQFISIEKWIDEVEVSFGVLISPHDIKLEKADKFEY